MIEYLYLYIAEFPLYCWNFMGPKAADSHCQLSVSIANENIYF
jgi:hypothetical protein